MCVCKLEKENVQEDKVLQYIQKKKKKILSVGCQDTLLAEIFHLDALTVWGK